MRTSQRPAGRGDRGAGTGLRLRGRRHRQDDGARRAVRRGGVRARARRRLDARDHVHGACRRRAARTGPRAPARGRPPRPGTVARRSLDLDDPRLLPAAAEGAPLRRGPRPALPRPRRQPGPRHPRRGVRGGAEPVLRRRRSGAAQAARDLRRLRPAPDADDRLRDAALGGTRAAARAGRAPRARGAPGGARRGCSRPGRGSGGEGRGAGGGRPGARARPPSRRCRSACSISAASACAPSAARASRRLARPCSRLRSTRWR